MHAVEPVPQAVGSVPATQVEPAQQPLHAPQLELPPPPPQAVSTAASRNANATRKAVRMETPGEWLMVDEERAARLGQVVGDRKGDTKEKQIVFRLYLMPSLEWLY